MTEPSIDIVAGAAIAGISRERLLRKVQVHEVRGERRQGRWFVSVEDCKRISREQAQPAGR